MTTTNQVGASLPEHLSQQTGAAVTTTPRADIPGYELIAVGNRFQWHAHPQKPEIEITQMPDGVGMSSSLKVRMAGKAFDISMGVSDFLQQVTDGKIVAIEAASSRPPEMPPQYEPPKPPADELVPESTAGIAGNGPAPAEAPKPKRIALECFFHGAYAMIVEGEPDPGCPDCAADQAAKEPTAPGKDPVLDATHEEIAAAQTLAQEVLGPEITAEPERKVLGPDTAPQDVPPAPPVDEAKPEKPKRTRKPKAAKAEPDEQAEAEARAKLKAAIAEARKSDAEARELVAQLKASGEANSIALALVPLGCLVHVSGFDCRLTNKIPAWTKEDGTEGHGDLVQVADREGKLLALAAALTCRIIAGPGEMAEGWGPVPGLDEPEAIMLTNGLQLGEHSTDCQAGLGGACDCTGSLTLEDVKAMGLVAPESMHLVAPTCTRCGVELGYAAELCDACEDAGPIDPAELVDDQGKEPSCGCVQDLHHTCIHNLMPEAFEPPVPPAAEVFAPAAEALGIPTVNPALDQAKELAAGLVEIGKELDAAPVFRGVPHGACRRCGVHVGEEDYCEACASRDDEADGGTYLSELECMLQVRKEMAAKLAKVDREIRAILDREAVQLLNAYRAIGQELDLVPAHLVQELEAVEGNRRLRFE